MTIIFSHLLIGLGFSLGTNIQMYSQGELDYQGIKNELIAMAICMIAWPAYAWIGIKIGNEDS